MAAMHGPGKLRINPAMPAAKLLQEPWIRVKNTPRGTMASAIFRTPDGPARIAVVVPRKWLGVSGEPSEEEIAGIFSAIAKIGKKILKNKWVQRGAAAVASVYGVPPGVTMKALDLSGDLVGMAVKGGKKGKSAKKKIAKIKKMAKQGNKAAIKALKAIKHAYKAHKHSKSALKLVAKASKGGKRARKKLEKLARRSKAEPDNPKVQRAANVVRGAVQAIRLAHLSGKIPSAGVRAKSFPKLARLSKLGRGQANIHHHYYH